MRLRLSSLRGHPFFFHHGLILLLRHAIMEAEKSFPYKHSFENRCAEDGQLLLHDETYKLFFNTAGTKGDISPKLRSLLQYINDTTAYAVEQTDCELIRKIDRAVSMAKMDDEWRHA